MRGGSLSLSLYSFPLLEEWPLLELLLHRLEFIYSTRKFQFDSLDEDSERSVQFFKIEKLIFFARFEKKARENLQSLRPLFARFFRSNKD